MQVFVRTLAGTSSALEVPLCSNVWGLKLAVEAREGIPAEEQGLVYAGRQLNNDAQLSEYGIEAGSTVHLVLRVCGGKGGFGSLLRGLGRDGKVTDNFDACRDLSGRRLRHSLAEQKLAEWKAAAPQRELERIAMQHIKELARQQRKEEQEQVDISDVLAAQQEAVARTQAAVQDAIKAGVVGAAGKATNGTSAGGSGSPSSKGSEPSSSASLSGSESPSILKRKASDGQEPAPGKGRPVPPAKRSKMLAELEEVSDVSDDDDE